jgi:acyl carrier protein
MTEDDAKGLIVEAFESANITMYKAGSSLEEAILGDNDVDLSVFDIDSLASMEICISIEVNSGISISPAELEKITSVKQLAREIMNSGS